MAATGTKGKLLRVIDDMEIIAKELVENLLAPKAQKLSSQEHLQLAKMLVAKDLELKELLQQARQQEKVEEVIEALQEEVDRQDKDIHSLQSNLKEAENLLATAIYQAKQKLSSIQKASEKQVSSEELIKYAHRISASSAVAAPHNWQQGDTRRPYPTDIEMRQGFLGRMSDLPLPPADASRPMHEGSGTIGGTPVGNGPPGSFWQIGTSTGSGAQDIKPHLPSLGLQTGTMDVKNEDVEVMSTDSSSSSSSDSQ
ncbi:mediator of RNA polymerase II transcription subunit 4-like [Varroa jacobsoni]|uniref:Mediator of RNA polymerase II transcription subunit 4 n=1 Tax=Varroa destructor TaxID=109461 RepID=A0A7M7JZS7_VARDE|nr:mediator of RNA polymerase II transcription subunit 4-like [Varroa destructor]XP_022687500.1 mediator of RNA polymerase II transcription subunit 4-like [Varroa jacobsoni]